MRPEYTAALGEARHGITQGLIFLPSILIWIGIIGRRYMIAFVVTAFVLTWAFCWIHARHVQATKVANAVTEAELKDRDFDVAYRYAYLSGAIYTTMLCGLNIGAASIVSVIVRWMMVRRIQSAATQPP